MTKCFDQNKLASAEVGLERAMTHITNALLKIDF